MYKNNKPKAKQKYRLNSLWLPDTYLPLTKSTNLFSAKRQSVPVEEPIIFLQEKFSYLYRNQKFSVEEPKLFSTGTDSFS